MGGHLPAVHDLGLYVAPSHAGHDQLVDSVLDKDAMLLLHVEVEFLYVTGIRPPTNLSEVVNVTCPPAGRSTPASGSTPSRIFRTLEISQDRDVLTCLFRRRPDRAQESLVICMRGVGEIEPRDVHASAHHVFKRGRTRTRRPHRAHNFCSSLHHKNSQGL